MIREDTAAAAPQATSQEIAPITVSESAAAKLKETMAEKDLAGAGLRVFVSGGGCSGMQYGMAFETDSDEDDLEFSAGGVTVYVDPVSITYLQGAHIDFEESLMGGGFKIENPQAVASCGCGHSFRTSEEAAGNGGGGGGCGCG